MPESLLTIRKERTGRKKSYMTERPSTHKEIKERTRQERVGHTERVKGPWRAGYRVFKAGPFA